jgi:hypothetical protein
MGVKALSLGVPFQASWHRRHPISTIPVARITTHVTVLGLFLNVIIVWFVGSNKVLSKFNFSKEQTIQTMIEKSSFKRTKFEGKKMIFKRKLCFVSLYYLYLLWTLGTKFTFFSNGHSKLNGLDMQVYFLELFSKSLIQQKDQFNFLISWKIKYTVN